jgi:hypothetical protein
MNWESIRRFSPAGIFLNPAVVKGETLSLTTGSPAAAPLKAYISLPSKHELKAHCSWLGEHGFCPTRSQMVRPKVAQFNRH